MTTPKYYSGVAAKRGARDEVSQADTPNRAALPGPSFQDEGSEENGSFMQYSVENYDAQQYDREDASEPELPAMFADSFNSDEPMLSIEQSEDEQDGDEGDSEQDDSEDDNEDDEESDEEGDDGEDEEGGECEPRAKAPVYLHGMTHRPEPVAETELSDSIDDAHGEIEDEDFEEELRGETEDNLLIEDDDLRCWLRHKRATVGIETWSSEACRLYKLLFLRGLYPMFPSQWTWSLSQDPVPRGLFVPLGSDDKCLLKPAQREGYASMAIRNLFKLHIRVDGLRQSGSPALVSRIAPLIKQEIERYVRWADEDVGFWKKRDYVSPVFVIAYKTPQSASTRRPILEKCQSLVEKYREEYATRGIKDCPRCVYIFVVVQHIVLVMVADTERPDGEEPHPLAELDLSQKSHWLDYSLAISITVLMAKEALVAHQSSFLEIEWETDDPDA
ncbi:unnamed protein product [Discula destructiva]